MAHCIRLQLGLPRALQRHTPRRCSSEVGLTNTILQHIACGLTVALWLSSPGKRVGRWQSELSHVWLHELDFLEGLGEIDFSNTLPDLKPFQKLHMQTCNSGPSFRV